MNQYIPRYLKAKNRMLIFELIRSQRTISRGELVRQTGISFPTVLKIVDKLLELHVITESDAFEQLSGAGRRGHLLCFNPKAFYAIGISLEGQFMSCGLECYHAEAASNSDSHCYKLQMYCLYCT